MSGPAGDGDDRARGLIQAHLRRQQALEALRRAQGAYERAGILLTEAVEASRFVKGIFILDDCLWLISEGIVEPTTTKMLTVTNLDMFAAGDG